ncbi:Ribosomal protein L5 [Penicillium cf. griseofulvum]|nr:Ribosomal protein L5 [Penicillium cf. griseofulvum]
MAAREPSRYLTRALPRASVPSIRPQGFLSRRNVSDEAPARRLSDHLTELESASSLSTTVPNSAAASFDPLARAAARKNQLPRGRYQFRSPKYNRGPFSAPRAEQTFESTVSPDIMTLCYVHTPPGFKPPPKSARLREWDDSSPYHKNRVLRGPRGGDVLRLLRKPIKFNNIPEIERITIHSYVKNAAAERNSSWLHVAGIAVQAISNVRVETFKSKSNVAPWGIAANRDSVAVKAELYGENMYHFLGKLVDVVLPRIKDWEGVKGSSGDSSGNITFGLVPENVALFPELEINYDMYPPKMIPGCHITLHTTARTDKDARLLLSAMGIPFYGKIVN